MTSNTSETVRGEDDEDQWITDDEESEVDHLHCDANMPLDELFKLYSKKVPTNNNDTSQDENDGESYSSSDIEDDEDGESDRRHHLLHLLDNDNDDDTEDGSYEPDIIKVINIGDEYQADVDFKAEYDSSNENCDVREVPVDEVLWSSTSVSDNDNESIDEYLKTIRTEYPSSDDEISLQTLLNCQFDTELALAKFRQLPVKTIYSYSTWPLAEIHQFEEGLCEYEKNFFKISVYKCPNRSVREIVHFYYQWKKSERYRSFIKEQRRIDSLTSVSDMIEKFIEEQEQHLCTAAGVVDSTNPSSFLSNDYKLHAPLSSNSSISFVTIHQKETTTTNKRSFDQVDSGDESSPKKLSSTETTSTTV